MREIRFGVIGLGFGRHHVKTLANMDGVRLVAVADQLVDDLETCFQKYGTRTYRNGLELLEREELDAVSLCVSPRWRLPLIEKAAQMGIPMFVEKPWAANLAQAHHLAQLCERHHAVVMTGFSFRYLPAIVKLRALMDGELGSGCLLNGEYVFDWLPPNDHWLWDVNNGNGYFNENSCHLFDAVCCLLGDPVSVMAEGAIFQGSPSAEVGAITLRFSNGAIAALTVGGLGVPAFRNFPRIDLVTANGQAHLSGREHMWASLTWAVRANNVTQTFSTEPELLENTRYTHALRHFLNCLRSGALPDSGVSDGIRAVALAEAVYESASSGRKVQMTEYGLKGEKDETGN
jgi:predicted dehydrogenase